MLTSLTLGGVGRLTLEQHGFELHESTYTRIFSIINTAGLHDPGLVESSEVETQIWRNRIPGGPPKSYMQIFNCAEGWCP